MFQIAPMSSSNFLTRRYPECAQELTLECEVVFSAELALNGPIASYIVVDTYCAGGPTYYYSVREVSGQSRTVHGVSAKDLHVVRAASPVSEFVAACAARFTTRNPAMSDTTIDLVA